MMIFPARDVPVVNTTVFPTYSSPDFVSTLSPPAPPSSRFRSRPSVRKGTNPSSLASPISAPLPSFRPPSRNPSPCSTLMSVTNASRTARPSCLSSVFRISVAYRPLSAWALRACTAGPLPVLSIRICMKVLSMLRPISPPRASTSRARCPLAGPPMDGLHGISATWSSFMVRTRVSHPMRAAANAASQPAWPAPITITSYSLLISRPILISPSSHV